MHHHHINRGVCCHLSLASRRRLACGKDSFRRPTCTRACKSRFGSQERSLLRTLSLLHIEPRSPSLLPSVSALSSPCACAVLQSSPALARVPQCVTQRRHLSFRSFSADRAWLPPRLIRSCFGGGAPAACRAGGAQTLAHECEGALFDCVGPSRRLECIAMAMHTLRVECSVYLCFTVLYRYSTAQPVQTY